MSREPTLGASAIRRQFAELAAALDTPTTVYLIGGGALTLQELKPATKDIDLVVRERADLDRLRDALLATGYERPPDLAGEYERLGAAFILQRDTRRFDVFHRQVAGVLVLSDGMAERSTTLFTEGALRVEQVSLDDIFLFKSVANRSDDVDDMITLAQAGLDTAQLRAEIDRQIDLVGDDAFIGSMANKLERLAERGYSLSIHEDIRALDSQRQAASDVRQAVTDLFQTEYDDELYQGVPEHRLATVVDDIDLDAAIDWLERTNQIVRADDGTLRPPES